ncbi:hypothetical protein V0288_13015 [Pannus brasiliensis CCIBt3594]|uniref:DUF4149 domain-containing protein n=1 Tax=Pannus brasiliensis CCIBt3594 TaxID=1427578 RepID=A0AAW9QT44_9CHRO
MKTIIDRYFPAKNWTTLAMIVLGFWLSSSLVIDLVILPGLSVSGMMTQNGFASAGYLVFGIFNRLELLCAALVLCSFLVFHRYHTLLHLPEHRSLLFAGLLFGITVIYTYFLTPNLSGFGLLDPLTSASGMPAGMMPLQIGYWLLEVLKLALGVTLLRWCFRDSFKLA